MGRKSEAGDTKKQMVFARDRWQCLYCNKEPTGFITTRTKNRISIVPYDENHRWFEVDHIIPKSKGGDNSFDNLATICWECNNRKGNKIWEKPHIITLKYFGLKEKQK